MCNLETACIHVHVLVSHVKPVICKLRTLQLPVYSGTERAFVGGWLQFTAKDGSAFIGTTVTYSSSFARLVSLI